jgi:hypothetical protein
MVPRGRLRLGKKKTFFDLSYLAPDGKGAWARKEKTTLPKVLSAAGLKFELFIEKTFRFNLSIS